MLWPLQCLSKILDLYQILVMELSTFERFRQLLMKQSPQLEDNDQDIMSYYQLLDENRDCGAFDKKLRQNFKLDPKGRSKLYHDLVVENIFKINQKAIFVAWLVVFIQSQFIGKEQEKSIQNVDEHVKEIKDVDDLIKSLLQYLALPAQFNLSQKEEQILTAISKQLAYQMFKKQYQFKPEGKGQKGKKKQTNKEDTNSILFKEQWEWLKKDLARYTKNSLEYAIQDAIIDSFEIHHELKEGSITEKILTIRQLYESQKEYITFENSEKINNLMKKLDSHHNDHQNCLDILKQLKRNVLVIDLFYLERLIKKAAETKQLIKGKQVILMVGNTGSGKSTNILKFLGNNFKQMFIGSLTIYVPDDNINPLHISFHTSPKCVSCTSFINAIEIPQNMKAKITGKNKMNEIMICDTPGFRDTRGCQNDISNQFGTVNALYGVKNLRIVLFFSNEQLIASRASLVKDMAATINSLCPNWDDIADSLVIYINQKEKIQRPKVQFNINDIIQNNQQNQISQDELLFLQKLKEAAQKLKNYVNPIKQTTEEYQQKLAKLMKLSPISKKIIESSFKYSFSADSKNSIDRYLSQCKNSLTNLFRSNNFERAQIYYERLDLLIKLLSGRQSQEVESDEDEDKSNVGCRQNVSPDHLNEVHKFILHEITIEIENFEKNLQRIVDLDKNQQFYEMGINNMKRLHNIYQFFKKYIPQLEIQQKIKTLIKTYGQRIKEKFTITSSIQDCEKSVRRILIYTEKFSCRQIVEDFVREKEILCIKQVQQLEYQVKHETYEINKQRLQLTDMLCRFLTIIKDENSDQFVQANKLNQVRNMADKKFLLYIEAIMDHINSKITAKSIRIIDQNIYKMKKLLNLDILTEIEDKIKKQETVNKMIKDCCKEKLDKMSKFLKNTNKTQLFDKDSISEVQSISEEILELMKIPLVQNAYSNKHQDLIGDLKESCNESIDQLKEEWENINGLLKNDIFYFEKYCQKLKTILSKLLKYSIIINRVSEVNTSIETLVPSILTIFDQEIKSIKGLELAKENVEINTEKLTIIGRKIVSLDKIIFNDSKFQPLKNKMKEILDIFDEKVSTPIIEFNETLMNNMEVDSSINQESKLQESKIKSEPRIFYNIKNNLDIFENIISYVVTFKEQKAFSECKMFKKQCELLKKNISTVIVDNAKKYQASFIQSEDPIISEDFFRLVQVLGQVQEKDKLSSYLTQIKFNPKQQTSTVSQKLEEICKSYQQRIEKQQDEDFEKMSERISQFKKLERLMNGKKKGENQLQSSYSLLHSKIQEKVKDKTKQVQSKIQAIMSENQEMSDVFEQLLPIIRELEEEETVENKLLLDKIFTQLMKRVDELVKKIKGYQKKSSKSVSLSPRSQYFDTELILHYVTDCKSIIDFDIEIKKLKTSSCSKYIKCKEKIQKISKDYIEKRFEMLNNTFSDETEEMITAFESIDLQKMKQRYPIIVKVEECFMLSQTKDKLKGGEYFKNRIMDITASKIKESANFISTLRQNRKSESISSILKSLIRQFNTHIAEKYQKENNFVIDENFISYYRNKSQEEQENLIKLVRSFMILRFERYEQAQGNYEDEESEAIRKEISLLPDKFRRQYEKEYNDNKQQYEENIENSKRQYIDNIKEDSSTLNKLLKNLHKSSNNKKMHKLYCQVLDECLDEILKKSADVQSRVSILKYYENAHNEPCLNKEDSKIMKIFKQNYKANLQYILTDMEYIFNKIRREVDRISSPLQNQDQKNISQYVRTTFQIFSTTQFKGRLFCSDNQSETAIQQQWEKFMQGVLTEIEQVMDRQKINTFMSADKSQLVNYFSQLQKASFIIKAIRNQYSRMIPELKKNLSLSDKQKIPLLEVKIQSAQSQDFIIENFKKQIQNQFNKLFKFEFITPGRYHETIEQTIQQLETYNKMMIDNEDKLDINAHYIFRGTDKDYLYKKYEELKDTLNSKFKHLVEQAIRQIDSSFLNYNNQPAKIINIYIKISKGLKKASCTLINLQTLNKETLRIQELVRQKFNELNNTINQEFKKAEEYYKNTESSQLNAQRQFTILISQATSEYNQKISKTKRHFEDRKRMQLPKCKNQEQKNALENKLKAEQNSAINILQDQQNLKKIELGKNKTDIINQQEKQLIEKLKNLCEKLIIFQKNLTEIDQPDPTNKKKFQMMMKQLQEKDDSFVFRIINCLKTIQDSHSYANKILKENKAFESYQEIERIQLTKTQDIEYVVNNIKYLDKESRPKTMSKKSQKQIKQAFASFNQQFSRHVKNYQQYPTQKTIQDLKTSCLAQSVEFNKKVYMSEKPGSSSEKEKLLAKIFAIYSILRTTQKTSKTKKNVRIPFKPHQIQVVTLLLLLGIVEDKYEKLSNRMAEVGTGQGKSIILAILSTYLALVGFNVRCVCYSMYLSSRDQDSFRFLFDFFDISDKVKYGTFNNVCEQILNFGDNDFKAEVYKMIMGSPKNWFNKISKFFSGTTCVKRKDSISRTPTILLVDEADVFFDSDFYGQCYRPSIKLKSPEISNLLKCVWQLAKQDFDRKKVSFKQISNVFTYVWQLVKPDFDGKKDPIQYIKSTAEFKEILKKYPNLKQILENQLNAILFGAYNYKHDYFILEKRQKLAYRENDSINEKLSYGYKTVFANLYEYERKNISKTNLDEALCIELIVAEFSYAILPKMFKHIIGVTGTLNSMPNFKKVILQKQYGVTDNYLIPSSFGLNEKKIHNFFQVQENQHYGKIIERIQKIDPSRPIIIFFKSATNLYDFNNYVGYSTLNSRTLILTEQHDSSYRERIVFMATQAGKITLMTKSFGRGTDFQIFDPKVNEKGGVHIIQTFLSIDQPEQNQIMGRTNRQNSNGSYDVIFKSNELDTLKLSQDFTTIIKEQISNHLSIARERLAEQLNDDIRLLAQISEQKHKKVDQVYSNKQLKQQDLIKYIRQINECKTFSKETIRTVFGIDGTGSMTSYLSKVVAILQETFGRTYEILKKQKVDLNVEIMVMIYRNYNSSPAQLLESTPFQNCLDNLLNFLSKVRVSGGCGNEAIEVYFQAVNNLEDVSQAILIGDIGWNTRDEVKIKRQQSLGDSQWTSNGFPPAYAEDELAILKSKNIPIHTFYIGSAKKPFEAISRQTAGKANPWPIKVYKPAQALSDFISRQIMKLGDEKMKKNGKKTNLEGAYVKRYN